jgi:hypothetical protein
MSSMSPRNGLVNLFPSPDDLLEALLCIVPSLGHPYPICVRHSGRIVQSRATNFKASPLLEEDSPQILGVVVGQQRQQRLETGEALDQRSTLRGYQALPTSQLRLAISSVSRSWEAQLYMRLLEPQEKVLPIFPRFDGVYIVGNIRP